VRAWHAVVTTMDREPVEHHWTLRIGALSFELGWRLALGRRFDRERAERNALLDAAMAASDRETVLLALEDFDGDRAAEFELLQSIIDGRYVSPWGET
jgi:hypothetical protein